MQGKSDRPRTAPSSGASIHMQQHFESTVSDISALQERVEQSTKELKRYIASLGQLERAGKYKRSLRSQKAGQQLQLRTRRRVTRRIRKSKRKQQRTAVFDRRLEKLIEGKVPLRPSFR